MSVVCYHKRHEVESVRGKVQQELARRSPPETPTCDTGRMRLSPPRAAAARVGILPSRHLNLSLGFAVGSDDIGTCCVHDWLWLLKLQPPKRRCLPKLTSFAQTVQASWFSAPHIQKSLVTGSISMAKFLEDDPRSSRQIGPPKDTNLGHKHYFFMFRNKEISVHLSFYFTKIMRGIVLFILLFQIIQY